MSKLDRIYSVRVDGFEITRVTLSKEEWGTQHERDKIKSGIAATWGVRTGHIRMQMLPPKYIVVTDMDTGISKRKELTDDTAER